MILSESCLRDTGDFRESKIADTVEEAIAKLTIHLIATIMKEDRGTQVPQVSRCNMSAQVIDKETVEMHVIYICLRHRPSPARGIWSRVCVDRQ